MSNQKVCRRQLERVQGENIALKAEVVRLNQDRKNLIYERDVEHREHQQAEARLAEVVEALEAEVDWRDDPDRPTAVYEKTRAALAAAAKGDHA